MEGKMTKDKRDMERIGSCNLSHFTSDDGTASQQGMGRTLNLSQGGILLETSSPIELKKKISMAIAIEDDLIKITGEVMHTTKEANGKFKSGIKFLKIEPVSSQILNIFIKFIKDE